MKKLLYLFISVVFIACNSNKNEEADLKLIPVQSGQYWGYIDHEGKFKINPQFAFADPFYEGLALVRTTDNKYGFINEDGKYVINAQYKDASDFSNGLALTVKEDGKLEYINTSGETKISLDGSVEAATKFNENLAAVVENKNAAAVSFVGTDGKTTIPVKYKIIRLFSSGLAVVGFEDTSSHKRTFGYINTKGELAIPYQFSEAGDFKDGLARVSNGTKYGFIDKDGKFVINPQFDLVYDYENDLATIKQGDLYGYIDKTGKMTINPQFKDAGAFYGDLASVTSTDGKVGYIDKTGKYIINPQFDYASQFYGEIAFVKMGGKFGVIDKTGKIIINPQFDGINTDGKSDYGSVESDYFDPKDVISLILENVTDKSYSGFSDKTTFKDIKARYPNINENNYNNFSTSNASGNRFVRLTEMGTSYRVPLTTAINNYVGQQVYDPVAGGYTTQNVLAGSKIVINVNDTLQVFTFRYQLIGKAREKKAEVVKMLHDAIKEKGLVDQPDTYNAFALKNKQYSVVCDLRTNFDISLSVTFGEIKLNPYEDLGGD